MKSIYATYTGINIVCLLLGIVFLTVDTNVFKTELLIATAGAISLLLIQNFNSNTRFFTVLAYLFVFWGMTSQVGYFGYMDGSWFWILLVVLLVVVLSLDAPATFLSGYLYGFWLLAILFGLNNFLGQSNVSFIEQIYSIDNIFNIILNYQAVLFLFGFFISVLPYYLEKRSSQNALFHAVAGLPLYLLTLPVQLIIGFGMGSFNAVKNYIEAFRRHVHKQSYSEAERNEQPAFEIYWFKKVFADLKNTHKASKQKNVAVKLNFLNKASSFKRIYGPVLGAVPYTVMRTASFNAHELGYLFLSAFSFIHLLVAVLIYVPFYVGYRVVAISDKLFLRMNKVATVCPSCYHRSELPDYVCDKCGREHTDLRPGIFGIRKRQCLCGNHLPATSFDQRYELQAKCKNVECKADLLTKESTPFCISVIGGPSSGKTSFVLSAIRELKEKVTPRRSWNMEFLKSMEEERFQQEAESLYSGFFPNKTAETKPFALNLKFSSKKWKTSKLLYLYDAAGEAYRSSQELATHKYYPYLDGYILVVDPFAMPQLVSKYTEEIAANSVSTANPSETLLEDTYDMLMVHLAKNHGIKENKKITVPLAIVINKVDVINLEEKIGAIQGTEEKTGGKSENEYMNEQCKAFLKSVGYSMFVKMLESKFTYYQFFLSTSLPEKQSVEEKSSKPITWLMEQKGYS